MKSSLALPVSEQIIVVSSFLNCHNKEELIKGAICTLLWILCLFGLPICSLVNLMIIYRKGSHSVKHTKTLISLRISTESLGFSGAMRLSQQWLMVFLIRKHLIFRNVWLSSISISCHVVINLFYRSAF